MEDRIEKEKARRKAEQELEELKSCVLVRILLLRCRVEELWIDKYWWGGGGGGLARY